MNLLEFIFKWQTLIGAVLGGIFALATAFVVAITVRRREDVTSGMVVIADLAAVRIAAEALNSLAKHEKIKKKEMPLWFSDKLVSSHPKLSALFEASVARLMPLDVYLAAHLSLCPSINGLYWAICRGRHTIATSNVRITGRFCCTHKR